MSAVELERGTSLQRLAGIGGGVAPDVPVTGMTLDSRDVEPGAAFIAVAGHTAHGLDYLADALERGARAVLYDAAEPRSSEALAEQCRRSGASAVAIPGLAARVGPMAAAFYGRPDRLFERIVAVTGTDGKTSVAHFVAQMLDEPGRSAAVLGTLGSGRPGATATAGLTTPDAPTFQAELARLARQGVRRLAIEASSHGLAQYRLDGTRFDAAVLTHIGRDHLDYHGSQEAYAAAKRRLFDWPALATAVLNVEDVHGAAWAGALEGRTPCITYGRWAGALRLAEARAHLGGLALTLSYAGAAATVRVPVMGAFNADNGLAAAGALLALGYDFATVTERLERVRPVAGRMELFRPTGAASVVVDYAHTAQALAAALAGLRAHTSGRVWCIFGAGGDRDRGKRPAMGLAAARGADRVIVTDDNPRSEEPGAIVADILSGMPDGSAAHVEHDRGRALAQALNDAGPSDLILLAGKGHEAVQIRDGAEIDWSDREAAQRAVAGGAGP
jgi:UDP-N-acetylmuramoyl-L-alanyl-D-glutamate--2,6-diaminopimelate ligase